MTVVRFNPPPARAQPPEVVVANSTSPFSSRPAHPVPPTVSASWLDTRTAGVLAHVTSLPGDYGIGNLGPGARAFIDFLARNVKIRA